MSPATLGEIIDRKIEKHKKMCEIVVTRVMLTAQLRCRGFRELKRECDKFEQIKHFPRCLFLCFRVYFVENKILGSGNRDIILYRQSKDIVPEITILKNYKYYLGSILQ